MGNRWENKNRKGRATTTELRDSYFGQLSEDEVNMRAYSFANMSIILFDLSSGLQTLPAL